MMWIQGSRIWLIASPKIILVTIVGHVINKWRWVYQNSARTPSSLHGVSLLFTMVAFVDVWWWWPVELVCVCASWCGCSFLTITLLRFVTQCCAWHKAAYDVPQYKKVTIHFSCDLMDRNIKRKWVNFLIHCNYYKQPTIRFNRGCRSRLFREPFRPSLFPSCDILTMIISSMYSMERVGALICWNKFVSSSHQTRPHC